jgi:hypothetical protein
MPLCWEITHADKLITIVGEGVVTLKDVEVYLDAIVTADAMPYAKLFDASKVVPEHDDHDLMMLGARMSAYSSTLKGGPLAFVVASQATRETVERYINLSKANRPVAIFATATEARGWIDAQPRD